MAQVERRQTEELQGRFPTFAMPELNCVVLKSKSEEHELMTLKFLFFNPSEMQVVTKASSIVVGHQICCFVNGDRLSIVDCDTGTADCYRISPDRSPEKIITFNKAWVEQNLHHRITATNEEVRLVRVYKDWTLFFYHNNDALKTQRCALVNLREKEIVDFSENIGTFVDQNF